MKLSHVALLLAFLAGSSLQAHAQHIPCGNKNDGGAGGGGQNKTTGPGGGKGDPVVPYTGNEFRRVDDLQLWGAVGNIPMVWSRHSNSRAVAGASLFGIAHYWRHSFQWELAPTSNDAAGRARVTLIYPDGGQFTFTEVSPGSWLVTGTLADRLQPTPDGFVLLRQDSTRYFFRKFPSGTSCYYLMDQIQDEAGNAYAVEYNTSRQVTKITEPAGRFLRVSYKVLTGNKLNPATLATLSAAPAPGEWMDLPVTNAAAFRYIRVQQADMSFGNIAEIQVYADDGLMHALGTNATTTPSGGNLIIIDDGFPTIPGPGGNATLGATVTGTVICSDSSAAGRAAFDGNPNTAFVSGVQSGGYVGLDLGTAKKIVRVRVLSAPGKESLHKPAAWGCAALKIEGANAAPLSVTAISKVETSDGRAVTYEYTPVADPTLPYVFPALTAAVFGDGTRSEYKHIQVFPGSRPLVSEWDDVRYELRQGHYKTVYQSSYAGTVLGAVDSQINLETGAPILKIDLKGGNLHMPMVTYANGGSEIQCYNTSLPTGAAITQEIDQNNNATNYTYGALGYMATKKDPLGRVTAFIWTPQGQPLTKTNPDASVESWTYNDLGLLLTYTDPLGRVTTSTRDESNRIVRTDYPDASYETFAYNAHGQVVSHRQRNGGTESFTYDARSLLIQKSDALGNVTTYGYDSADRLARATDALGRTTTIVYNERGLVTGITNPDASTRTFTYTKYGDVASETNELGKTWSYTYDVFRRVTGVTDPLARTVSTAYQPDSYEKKPLAVTSPSGRKAAFAYDKEWNLLSTTNAAGTSAASTTTFAYDKAYNIVSATDALGKTTSATYDTRDRKLTTTDPLGNISRASYDKAGNVLTTTRPDGGVTTSVYDAMNRVVQMTDPKAQTTTMAYDPAGNPASMTDPRGSVYSWTYDLLNRPTSMAYPGGSREQYGYDAAGNPTTYTTRAGQTRTSVFNVRNREVQTNWSDSTPSIARTFDAAGRMTSENNGTSQISTSYDAANQATGETTAVTGQPARAISYSYDADGRRISTTYPGGSVVSTGFTDRSQVATIGLDGATVAQYEYNPVGNVTAKTLENGMSALYSYDAAHRLTAIEHRKGADLLASFAYTLDSVGNRKSKAAAGLNPLAENYAYDAVDQVIQAKYGTARTVAYTYDASGNRLLVNDSGTSQNYAANALNQYTSVGGTAQTYDANGNLIGTSSAAYAYDAQNRLVNATVNGTVTTFAYDPRNRAVQRTANGTITNLTYDGWNLIEERDGTGALQQVYVHGAAVDEILTKVTTTGAVYYHADGLGNTVALTNETGQLVESTTYDAFGAATIRSASGSVLAASSVANRFLFTGREWVSDTGIYDYRNRVYSPALGRFLQSDPIRFAAGDVSIYRYCGNNPGSAVDSEGLATYRQNRQIGGDARMSNSNPASHTFIFTTNPDGTLKHT